MMSVWTRIGAVACLIAPLLAACGTDVQDTYPTPQERHPTSGGGYSGPNEGQDSIFGPGGLFGKSDTKNQGGGGGELASMPICGARPSTPSPSCRSPRPIRSAA